MMYPSAIQGHMPFVDKYKQEQIKKVLEKARSRHHSGPDKFSTERHAKQRDTASMPILWQSVYTGQKPRFISMPNSLNSHQNLNLINKDDKNSPNKPKTTSILSAMKKIFSKNKDSRVRASSSGAIIHGNIARSYSAPSTNSLTKKPADSEISSNRSPKRQRLRTISNKSGIMETIEEVNEIIASADDLNRSSSPCSDCDSIASAPEAGAGNLFYGYGELSGSSSSSNHGSNDILCAA